jgi:hypothetical protein
VLNYREQNAWTLSEVTDGVVCAGAPAVRLSDHLPRALHAVWGPRVVGQGMGVGAR